MEKIQLKNSKIINFDFDLCYSGAMIFTYDILTKDEKKDFKSLLWNDYDIVSIKYLKK